MNPKLAAVAHAAGGAGILEGGRVAVGTAQHPVCGDEVRIYVEVEGANIARLAWQARGCPATLAVASAAHTTLVGSAAADAARLLRACLAELGDLAVHERHAEKLFLEALQDSLQAAKRLPKV